MVMGTVDYLCSNCGGSATEVITGFTRVDERYVPGHCLVCTPWPPRKRNVLAKDKEGEFWQPARKSISLVRADVFDRKAFDHRKKVEAARVLIAKAQAKDRSTMTKEQLAAVQGAIAFLRREE